MDATREPDAVAGGPRDPGPDFADAAAAAVLILSLIGPALTLVVVVSVAADWRLPEPAYRMVDRELPTRVWYIPISLAVWLGLATALLVAGCGLLVDTGRRARPVPGAAMAGTVLAVLQILFILGLLATDTLRPRDCWGAGNESSASGSCRTIFNAQQVFKDVGKSRRFLGTATNEYSPDFRDLYLPFGGTPADGTLSDNVLATTFSKAGYDFGSVQGSADGDCTRGGTLDPRYQWEIFASPTDPGNTGDRYFWVSEAGDIRWTLDPHAPDPRTDTSGTWSDGG